MNVIRPIVPLLALLGLALCPSPGVRGAAGAHEDREPREIRETREPRELRDAAERASGSDGGHGSRDDGARADHGGGPDDRPDQEHGDDGRDGGGHGDDGRADDGHGGKDGRDGRRDDGKGGANGSGRRDGDGRGHRGREPRVEFERDARGAERVRGEVLVVGRHEEVAALRAAGYTLLDVSPLGALDAEAARVSVPEGRTIDALVEELQRLLPAASVAADHLYRASAQVDDAPAATSTAPEDNGSGKPTIGVIDTGIDPATPALQGALREQRGFAPGGYVARSHGTAVGDIAARAGVYLLSADVFGVDTESNLAATTLALAQSIDWLLMQHVPVINVSIEGPDNPIVARVIRRAVDAGVAVVAAAGNAGPSAPPAYPAAYPGVIAVTAVDARGRVYRRANRGAYIAFAARGVDVATPRRGGGTSRESGTSFAAPIVAATLAQRIAADPDEPLPQVLAAFARGARDLGAPGRDAIFGWGEIDTPRVATVQRR